jgi:hypothetical protein
LRLWLACTATQPHNHPDNKFMTACLWMVWVTFAFKSSRASVAWHGPFHCGATGYVKGLMCSCMGFPFLYLFGRRRPFLVKGLEATLN